MTDENTVLKENIISRRVSFFPKKHSSLISSLLLFTDQKTVISGCSNSQLMRHSLQTLKAVQGFMDLNIGELFGIDMKRNLLVVGGENMFCILRLTKKSKNGNYSIWYIYWGYLIIQFGEREFLFSLIIIPLLEAVSRI